MALVRWAPLRGLFDIQRDMDLLMRRMWNSFDWPGLGAGPRSSWVPAVDVFPREGDLVIRAEVPGIDPEKDLEITVQDGVLYLRGERRHEERADEDGGFRFESAYGSFERSLVLPEGVKDEDIHASYENGILEVVIRGAGQLSTGRKIPVQVGRSRKALTTRGRKS